MAFKEEKWAVFHFFPRCFGPLTSTASRTGTLQTILSFTFQSTLCQYAKPKQQLWWSNRNFTEFPKEEKGYNVSLKQLSLYDKKTVSWNNNSPGMVLSEDRNSEVSVNVLMILLPMSVSFTNPEYTILLIWTAKIAMNEWQNKTTLLKTKSLRFLALLIIHMGKVYLSRKLQREIFVHVNTAANIYLPRFMTSILYHFFF